MNTASNGIWVELSDEKIVKFRADVTNPSWHRLSNRFTEDPDFYNFDHGEKIAWIYIMGQASQKASARVFVNFVHADRAANIKTKTILSTIEKLKRGGQLIADVSSTVRERSVDDPQTVPTEQTDKQTDKQTKHAESNESVRSAIFDDEVFNDFISSVNAETQELWLKTYEDQQWIEGELKRAVVWCSANQSRAPKSNHARFISNWLSRGWESHRKSRFEASGYGASIKELTGSA